MAAGEKTRRIRTLTATLHDLGRTPAPERLLPRVLAQTTDAPDRYFAIDTPLGPTWVAYNERGISAVTQVATAAEFEVFVKQTTGRLAVAEASPPERLVQAISRCLAGDKSVKLDFDLRGLGDFARAVLAKALEIPFGEVRPYHWIAREIGRPKAVRAVGTALARNPIPLFIPCHRVVRGDGHIGNYGMGGRDAKIRILKAEGVDALQLEHLARTGGRYLGSDTTHIFCYPTCRHARAITPQHTVKFATPSAAQAAGYRPCKVCRPDAAAA